MVFKKRDSVPIAQDIPAFVMYCVNGESGSSLLIESTDSMISLCFTASFKTGIRCNSPGPQQTTLRHTLEKTQKFELKVCTKNWSSDYAHHLKLTNLPFCQQERLYLKLTLLFQFLNDSFLNPSAPLVRQNLYLNLRYFNNIQFKRQICHTNAYMNSFSLTLYIQSCSLLSSFKHSVMSYLSV